MRVRGKRSGVLRRFEILLWIVGISLVGGALAETFARWTYQAQQERVLAAEVRGPAVSVPAVPVATPPPVVPAPAPAPPVLPPETVAAPEPPPPAVQPPRKRQAVARLEIPRLGIRAIVKDGADEKTLARAVGRVPGTARPGEIGNLVLAGHRDTFFRPLRRIRENDVIRLTIPPETYEYRVESTRVVEPEETNVLESKGVEELTLVTCYPFSFVGPSPQRFIVSATRVH